MKKVQRTKTIRTIIILFICITLSGCQSVSLSAEEERTAVLIVNPTSDQYPYSIELWSEYILGKYPDAEISTLSGSMLSADVLTALDSLDGDKLVFIYHGHGGDGYAWLQSGQKLPWHDVISLLKEKDRPFGMIIDCCYSGTAAEMFRSQMNGFREDALLLTSAASDEKSYGLVIKPENSASWLLRSLLLFDTVPSVISTSKEEQHPQLWRYDAETETISNIALPSPGESKINKDYEFLL